MKQLAYPYYRVSTKRQGRSGLGLDAQRKAVEDYARVNNIHLGKAYIEIESGRKSKRPVLVRALQTCRANKGLLLIAKLDRLGRNVAFISSLMEAGTEFRAVDNPQANKLMLHMLAAFAEWEADETSKRTKDALAAAKRRGTILGAFSRNVLAERNRQASVNFVDSMRLILRRLKLEGFTTTRAQAAELNRRQVPTYQKGGAKWHAATICRIRRNLERQAMQPVTS